MKTKMTKIMSLFLAALTAMNLFIVPASAVNLPSISSSKYISTYTYKSSGKIYAYKEAALKNKTGGYISCATDECRILKISGNAVQVSYPVSGGRRTAWFSREAFTYRDLAADGAASTFTASKKITTYRWKGNYTTYGYIAKGDKCYLLRGDKNSEWLQLVYPTGSTYKMAWVLGSDLYGTQSTSSDSEVTKELNALVDKYEGTYWTVDGKPADSNSDSKSYNGAIQCKGFAAYIFNQMFGNGYIGAYDSKMYYIPNPVGAKEVGKVWNFSSTDTETVKNLLSKGQPGDFIQVRRRDKDWGHSMILVDTTSTGIVVFDCNSDGKCGIKKYSITWSQFAGKNVGMSLYHSTKYIS